MTSDLHSEENCGLIASLAQTVGTTEPAIRLLLTLASGYPIGIIYRKYIQKLSNTTVHHIFFAICGIVLCAFNYGINLYHSLIATWTTYILLHLLHKVPRFLLIINFIFHMSYLLLGYYFTESNEYDILWTTPHCVLTLRMIGLGFDISDGRKPIEQLGNDQKETHLTEIPSLLELMGFAYFPSSFLIGPQFPFRRYKRFIDGEFQHHKGFIKAGIKRMLVGLLYLSVRQMGAMWIPDNYILSDDFKNTNFLLRLFYIGLWGKFALYKYISCWLLTEGALMCIGFTYNGKTPDGEDNWNGVSNIKLIILETGITMQDYVHSFNVNTNQWVAQYVYKRLKFLNNRTISYAAALGFLAVWHGFHSGYYMSFWLEYVSVTIERQIQTVYKKDFLATSYGQSLESSMIFKAIKVICLKLYNVIYMGWCLAPFVFLSYNRWIRVFSALNYIGFLYFAAWLVIYQLLKYNKRNADRKRSSQIFSNATTLSAQQTQTENNKKCN